MSHRSVRTERSTLPTRFSTSLVVAGVLALGACDSPGAEPDDRPLVPLAVGNSWTFASWYLDESWADTFRVEITGERTVRIDGADRRAFEQTLHRGGPSPYRWLYGNEPDGLHLYGGVSDTDTLLEGGLYLKYPARKGERYPFKRLAYHPDLGFYVSHTLTMHVVTTDTTITVGGRPLRCYGYRFRYRPADDVGEQWDVYEYYSPGAGHVAEVIRTYDPIVPDVHNTIKQQSTLIDYRVQ